jgi:hypothetical protein
MNFRGVFALALALGCSDNMGRTFADAGSGDAGCARNEDCDDRVPCTRDRCLVGGVCEHDPDNTMCTAPQVCTATGCGAPGARRCTSTAQCDDMVPCTRDTCLVDGTCRNTPQDDQCPMGQRCDTARGCASGMTTTMCRMASDCMDTFDCTEDACGVDGRCIHVPQNSRCGPGRSCAAGMGCIAAQACSSNRDCDDGRRCNGVERCSELACVAGTAVNCDDMMACTVDACVETGMEACTHTVMASCMGMVRSGIYNAATPARFTCSALGMVAVMLDIGYYQFSVSATELVVTPGPSGPTMRQSPPPTGAEFDVNGTVAGTCNELYRLQGRFTDATHFTGTFSVRFVDGFPGGCSLAPDCVARMFPVVGTARM